MRNHFWKTVLLSGLLVGTLDILAAFLSFYLKTGKSPLIVLKYIASAVFGRAAYSGDDKMVMYGLLFHFLIAFAWTLFFFLIYPTLRLRSWSRILTGVLYGVIIWLVMSHVVLPLSRVAMGSFDLKQAALAVLILVVAIGLPLSFIAYRFYSGAVRT